MIKLWNFNVFSKFSCGSLIFIKNYDQNSSYIKIHVILFVKGWKSFKVYHTGWKGPSPFYNPF